MGRHTKPDESVLSRPGGRGKQMMDNKMRTDDGTILWCEKTFRQQEGRNVLLLFQRGDLFCLGSDTVVARVDAGTLNKQASSEKPA